ncbi:MAG: WXG100 family type VII secretion target, partial [Anaerolineales bacterium]
MPSARIRCHYDQIKQVIGIFRNQNRDLSQLLKRIKTSKEVLAGGRWIGKGARQFYAEMDDRILPSLDHLIQAMDGGACHLEQVVAIMRQADQDSAGLFKVRDGAGLHQGPGSGDVEPSGPGSGDVEPTGPGSGDEVPASGSSAEPTGPGSGDVEPTGPGSGDVEPTGPGSGEVEPTGPGSGDVEPTGPGSGDVEPTGPGSGDEVPATGSSAEPTGPG